MSIAFPEGVIVRTAGTIILTAYIAIIMVALFLGPLILLHGYRQWWLVTFDVVFACAFIGGSIRHYTVVGPSTKS
jgi:general stress protein CsbA